MRYLRILIAIIALGCLDVHAYALDDEQGYLDPANPDENANAKHQIKDTMQSDIFNINSKGSSFISSSLGPENSDMRQEKDRTSSLSSTSGSNAAAANLAGSWSLDLRDTSARTLSLNILQYESMVFGKGTMTSSDGGSQEIAATGIVEGSKVHLDIISLKDLGLFKLRLSLSGSSISGSYDAYSASKAPLTGTASGGVSG